MAISFSESLKLGDYSLTLAHNGYTDDYHFCVIYRFKGRILYEQLPEIFDDFEKTFGEVENLEIMGYDAKEQERMQFSYVSLKQFSEYGLLPSERYRFDRAFLRVKGRPTHIDLRNETFSDEEKNNNMLYLLCYDDSFGGTVPVKEKETKYYLSEGRLVKHSERSHGFYVWDVDKNEWQRSFCASNDFYGWGGWGDDCKPFYRLDMETILKDYMFEHGVDEAQKKYNEQLANGKHDEE